MSSGGNIVGRFAPSPTGRMHLGNVFSALLSYLSAKSAAGEWILRIEDLDRGRCRREYIDMVKDDLEWLGLEWDRGGEGRWCQSERSDLYEAALKTLEDQRLTYPCWCTRAELMASSAPHESDGRLIYPGTCRPASLSLNNASGKYLSTAEALDSVIHAIPGNLAETKTSRPAIPGGLSDPRRSRPAATRIIVPDRTIEFTDRHYGPQTVNLSRECGDFVLRRSSGDWAYQLAVVVDDALMGVTEVVRGRDLLLSAAQQIYLFECLGYKAPEYAHFPLLCNSARQRLSKRDASLDMSSLRARCSAQEIIGLLAHYAGLIPTPEPCTPADLIPLFDWNKVPMEDIIL